MVSESQTGTGIVLPWEQAAIRGEEMPDGLNYADQVLFLNLRTLYAQKRMNIIDRETAVREKKKLLDNYRLYQFREQMEDEWIKGIRATEILRANYRKDRTLENADILVKTLEGMMPVELSESM